VVGPGGHCGGGQVPWTYGYLDQIFADLLSDALFAALRNGDELEAREVLAPYASSTIFYYVMGPAPIYGTEIGNYWSNSSEVPYATQTPFFFAPGGFLSTVQVNVTGSVHFTYDPLNPVPTLGGNNLLLPQCGPWDQRNLEKRSDVVIFTSSPFKEPTAITGRMYAVLHVSSNCTDTDFTVKITDLYPNGTSMLLQDGIARMRWREDTFEPSWMTPGEVYQVIVDLWSTSYIFNIGHSVRVDISSSNYPRFSANYNNGNLLNQTGTPITAANSIYYGGAYQSGIVLPIVPIPPPMDIEKFMAYNNIQQQS